MSKVPNRHRATEELISRKDITLLHSHKWRLEGLDMRADYVILIHSPKCKTATCAHYNTGLVLQIEKKIDDFLQ